MKTRRQTKILELIKKYEIGTQEDLSDYLEQEGYQVTQATVSRDIRELKLTKVSLTGGRQKYVALLDNGLENSPVMDQDDRCPIKSVGHGTTTTADLTTEREVFDTIIELSEEIGMKLRKNHISCVTPLISSS